jgi:hypothetical protein
MAIPINRRRGLVDPVYIWSRSTTGGLSRHPFDTNPANEQPTRNNRNRCDFLLFPTVTNRKFEVPLVGGTLFISEFLARECPNKIPRASGATLVHFHCRQHTVLKTDDERTILNRVRIHYEISEARLLRNGRPVRFRKRQI